jgi:hypothetical protein
MKNVKFELQGFYVVAILGKDGKPTGLFQVLDRNGQVVHYSTSLPAAVRWLRSHVEQFADINPPTQPPTRMQP